MEVVQIIIFEKAASLMHLYELSLFL